MKNQKGFILEGLTALQIGFISVCAILIGISQLPPVKTDFRAKKAVILCEEGYRGVDVTDCAAWVEGKSEEAILVFIKDDIEVPQPVMRPKLGG